MALIFNASRILRRCSAAVLAAAIFCAAPLAAHAADSYWSGNAGSTGAGDWGTAGNWDSGVPTVTDNAILPDPLSGSGNYVITLGTNAVAKSLFVQGGDVLATPPAYQFETGTLTLADQLWINSSTVDTFLSIGSGATVVTPNGTVGAAASTNRNELSVESGGALNVSGQLNVAYEGSSYAGLYVYGSATLGTLNVGGLATANSASVYNYGTLDVGTIGGDVLVGAGGSVSPGAYLGLPLGSLSFLGDVDFTNGGTLAIDLGASGTSDFIDVAGSLLLAGSTLDLTIAVQDAGVAYVIAHYGSLSGLFATVNGLPGPSWHVDYNYQGLNEIAIVSDSLVPEIDPSSFGSAFALLMGSLGLIERRTRRVRSFVTAA